MRGSYFYSYWISKHIYRSDTMTLITGQVTVGSVNYFCSTNVFLPLKGNVGAAITCLSGQTLAKAIISFENITARPLKVHRIYSPAGIIPSLSIFDLDLVADRKVSLNLKPTSANTPAQLDNLLASCKSNGLSLDISIWAEMHRQFSNPGDYINLCKQYVPVIHQYGYQHIYSPTCYAMQFKGVGPLYYPGDSLVDICSVDYYDDGSSLKVASDFADSHDKPLGIGEFGVLQSSTNRKTWLTGILALMKQRLSDGKFNSDICYFHSNVGGNFFLDPSEPDSIQVYQQLYDEIGTDLAF